MSLLFGNLTQDFVTFATIINKASSGDPSAQSQVPAAAASFRSAAGKDAGYLACIGKSERKIGPNSTKSCFKVLASSFAPTYTCLSGCIPAKSMPSVSEKSISKRYYGRIFSTLTKLEPGKSRREFKQIHVS